MVLHLRRLIVSFVAVMAFSHYSRAMADASYYGYAYNQDLLDVYNSNYTYGYPTPGFNQFPTGTSSGNASYSNSVNDGLNGNYLPLFYGVWNSSQTNGFASLSPPGSSARSSISNESEFSLYYAKPGILAFDVQLSTNTSVSATSPDDFAVSFADTSVYVDGTEVLSISSTAGTFGTGLSYSTSSSDDSGLLVYYAHAGWNTIDTVTYTNGYAYTIASAVPEPSSIVMMGLGGVALAGLFFRRCRERQAR
jgi:hypothetical protein